MVISRPTFYSKNFKVILQILLFRTSEKNVFSLELKNWPIKSISPSPTPIEAFYCSLQEHLHQYIRVKVRMKN